MVSTWKTTELWRLLEAREGAEAAATRHYISSWLDDVETLLAKSATAPLDFTLHDDEHSFRVAQRMDELIPRDTAAKMSVYELALLLMAAYLHDIGMNPNRGIVRQIRDFLLTGKAEGLSGAEASLLQVWLDQSFPGTEPPLMAHTEAERIYLAELYTSYYCRYRHNDWRRRVYFILRKKRRKNSVPGVHDRSNTTLQKPPFWTTRTPGR